MFDPFFDAIAGLLAWFYELPLVGGSYGAAIILLTLTVMILVTPLTLKGTRSMMTMQALQPEIKRIQQDYADDRVRMNEELLAFYKENQINPVGGCLPLLLQMPVFILLYQVIQGLTRTDSDGYFDPKYLDPSSELYQDLHGSTEMVSWGLDLAQSAADALRVSFVEGIPYIVLIALVASTSYIQQKQISGRNPNAEMPAQQKMLLRVMPVFFAFISFNFAAALVVYFLVSNLYRIGQQAYISKRIYGSDSMFGRTSKSAAIDTTATEASGGSKSSGAAIASKGDSSGKGSSSGGSASGRGAGSQRSKPPADKKPRPPSGRVTPPKSTGGNQQRRRKKRS